MQSQYLASSQALQKNLALLRGIMESTPDAVFVKDLESRYVMINPAAARFVDMSLDEVLGSTDEKVFPKETGQWVMERDRQVIEKGVTLTYELSRPGDGGNRTYLTTRVIPRCEWPDRGGLRDFQRHHRQETGGRGDPAVAAKTAHAL